MKSSVKPYNSVQILLSSSFLPKNIKIKRYRTVILTVVVYGYEPWSITLREEHNLRVFQNRVQMTIFGSEGDEVTGDWEKTV